MSVKIKTFVIIILILFSVDLFANPFITHSPDPKKLATAAEEDPDDEIGDDYDVNYLNQFESSFISGLETIVCTPGEFVNVRSDDLSEILFTVKNEEPLTVFQGWGENSIVGTINGKKYTFIKIEMTNKKDNETRVGFIESSFVQPKSKCPFTLSVLKSLIPEDTTFSGLDDLLCCQFPTIKEVTTPYTEGMRAFGGPRNKGKRAHAAADLYRYENEPLVAVAPGVVLRNLYYFYQDTYALEVLHSGGFVVRYGEVTGKSAPGIEIGKQLKMGETIGYMGKVNSGCCEAMLHFELYTGEMKGSLTQPGIDIGGILFNRRQDLINPTPHLLKWEQQKIE